MNETPSKAPVLHRNPWSWKMSVAMVVICSVNAGLGIASLDTFGFMTALFSALTVAMNIYQIKRAIEWERDNGSPNPGDEPRPIK